MCSAAYSNYDTLNGSMEKVTSEGTTTMDRSSASPSQWHIESSLSQGTSSSSSSSFLSSEKSKKHKMKKKHHRKKKKKKKPSIPYKVSCKERKRLHKLLFKNKIVPFIHTGEHDANHIALPKKMILNRMEKALPTKFPAEIGVSTKKKAKFDNKLSSLSSADILSSSKSTSGTSSPSDEQARAIKFKFHKTSSASKSKRMESSCHACKNESAIDALLALGGGRTSLQQQMQTTETSCLAQA